MQSAYIRSLNGPIPLTIPSAWQVLTIAAFKNESIQKNVSTLATSALNHPTGSQGLEERLKSTDRICILIEDLTRSSPKKIILDIVLKKLRHIGISKKNITIVIALGTHQPLSIEELENAFGKELISEYDFQNHDCHADDLVPIGRLVTGAMVKINRRVYEADFRIGIGSIFPHPLNGFGGGGKILFPGVADFKSIVEHHLKHSFRGGSYLGNITENSFHKEVTAMAKAGKLDFIVNSILDHEDRLFDIVCGDPVKAHRAGTAVCKRIISRSFTEKSDITIISAFPYSAGPQIMKPLAPASMITKPGGNIILYADCKVPLPEYYYNACKRFRGRYGNRLRQAVLMNFANNQSIIPKAPPEMNMSMAQIMLTLNDFSMILVSRDITAKQAKDLGCMVADDFDTAFALSAKQLEHPTVNIVPSGGVILPIIAKTV
ncbi:MAG: nickel-dependent lactate racemase [Desulfobacteraceae bacterium]|jgi:nickel-dependent lactate racemase